MCFSACPDSVHGSRAALPNMLPHVTVRGHKDLSFYSKDAITQIIFFILLSFTILFLRIIEEVYGVMRNEILLVQSDIITAYWGEEELWEHPLAQLLLPLLLSCNQSVTPPSDGWLTSGTCRNIMTPSPTLDPLMVLETLTFLPRSVIAGVKRRHVWITTATWIHAWITTATWSISPWLQAAERAALFSHTLPPLLPCLSA